MQIILNLIGMILIVEEKESKITDNGKKLLLEKESEWKLFSETVNSVLWEGSLCLK